MQQFPMIINGESVQAETRFGVKNPATGEVFAECQNGNGDYVDQAVRAARAAFPSWSRTSDAERTEKILAIADAMEANMPELMQLVTMENGKPMGGLNGVGSGMEVGGAIAWARYTASLEIPIDVIQDNDEARVEVHRKPLGVVASITPWNWPLMIAIWHVIPALKTGNTVVLKPSSFTPLSTIRFVELANEILPAGVLNLVSGESGVGSTITGHPDINKIVFTGSTPTGKRIMKNASDNLKRVTLELGGNDAGIVLPDINVKEMAPKLFGVSFHNNGQTCACLKRMYVHESIYDELSAELARLARDAVVGDGLEEGTELGPLQNQDQLDVVTDLVEDAKNSGATILAGGSKMDRPGYFHEPTIVTGLSDGARLVDEEQFGPALPIIKYSDIDEVIARANDNENGLGGSVWSSDPQKAAQIGLQLECGSVWINEHGAIQPDAPFGGVKQSGVGVEFGSYGLEEYSSLQTLKIMK
ncbi:aldehyde dehydrogenase family protein [Porticoccus sp. GXU_MW_L64]